MLSEINKQRIKSHFQSMESVFPGYGAEIGPTKYMDAVYNGLSNPPPGGVQDEHVRNMLDNRPEAEKFLAGLMGLV